MKEKWGQKNKVSFLRYSSLALCVRSLRVLADIYISIFSDIIIAFTDTLGRNMQIRHFLLPIRCLPAPHAEFSLASCIKIIFS